MSDGRSCDGDAGCVSGEGQTLIDTLRVWHDNAEQESFCDSLGQINDVNHDAT